MKIYCCRLKHNPSYYMKLVRLVGENYVPVTDPKDITFSGDLDEMNRLTQKFPEFEVCYLEAEPASVATPIGVRSMNLQ